MATTTTTADRHRQPNVPRSSQVAAVTSHFTPTLVYNPASGRLSGSPRTQITARQVHLFTQIVRPLLWHATSQLPRRP